jgi:hypothetical protein
MHTLAPRPAQALLALESLQESERRGVEGDSPWLGHDASLEDAISRQMIADAMDATPFAVGEPVTGDLLRRLSLPAADVPFDEIQDIKTAEVQASAMGHSPEMWSRYEYPPASTLLMDAAARLEGTIAEFAQRSSGELSGVTEEALAKDALASGQDWHLDSARLPAIGTLLTGQLTAQTILRDNAIVMLVENGIFPMARNLAQLGLLGTHEALVDGRLSEATVQLVSDIAASVATSGHPLGLQPRKTPEVYAEYVASVRDGLLMFVLGHEYGHILRGDLQVHPLNASPRAERPALDLESGADQSALRLTLGATVDSPLAGATLTSAMLFFAGQDLFDRIDAVMNHEPAPDIDDLENGAVYFHRAQRLVQDVQNSPLNHVYDDSVRLSMRAFHAVLFAWDIVAPALWGIADEFHDYAADPESGGDYIAELISGPRAQLWSRVQPLVPKQRDIKTIFEEMLN